MWVTTRESVHDDWGTPVNLGAPVNSSRFEFPCCISADGLELYFNDAGPNWGYVPRPGGQGETDLWVSTRPTRDHAWGEPVNLGPIVNSTANDCGADISADGLTLYFDSDRDGTLDVDWHIWVTTRATKQDPWGAPVKLNSIINDQPGLYGDPSISSDNLALFFDADFSDTYGSCDIYVITRPTTHDPWGTPVHLAPPVNTTYNDTAPDISADGRTLYFCDYPPPRPGGFGAADIWQASLVPIVDFNGDGKVDGFEVCVMANHWGMGESLCDIGPMPWGDGIVDVEDLKVLAEYIGEPVDDPTLIAHWALDEAEGIVAHDSVGDNDGTVMGTPAWRPDGGKVGGALEFDGTTFVVAGSVLDPSDGPFSVLAWVQGGAGGQAIVSQQGGANWLMTDELGCLMTELKSASRLARLLGSGSSIADGNWHRVAFTWDGSNRRLYADGMVVAEDTDIGLVECSGGLNIGAGSSLALATFWQGLIDEVRIYNRAVHP